MYLLIQIIQNGEAWCSKTERIPKRIEGGKKRGIFGERKEKKEKLMLLKATEK